jgi:NADH-quinone oxidoreductase subunit E
MRMEWEAELDRIIERYDYNKEFIIAILQEIQRVKNYLPRENLEYICQKLDLPLTRVYQIATFYKSFSLKPMGRHRIKVCTGTACHLKGAQRNYEEIRRRLDILEGDTTKDLSFSIEKVNCLGTCALAPVIVVNGEYYDSVNPAKIRKILEGYIRSNRQ